MDRRLAAILVADVVGFSRLMEQDESGTIAALRQRRAGVLDPVVKEHRGRIVKVMGDGVLVEFASAVNAVAAAIDLQKRMAHANAGVTEERQIVLRIGINLGDVVGAGSDIYGEGVNIAARLESLAEPGGICVSAKVRDEVVGKTAGDFEDMGEQTLKNIATPVRVWRIAAGEGAVVPRPIASPLKRDTSKPSVAVLPFDNMSGDPDQEYFSDGITEDIISALSRFRSLFVIARNSSFAFRGQKLTVPEIAKRLGVEYVVEGSVRRSGNRLRITAQLIEVVNGNHVWAERYDRSMEDIFAVQEEVASVVASKLVGHLEHNVASRVPKRPTDSIQAYELVIRSNELRRRFSPLYIYEAQNLLEKALSLDKNYAQAYASLAFCLSYHWMLDLNVHALDRSCELGRKAVLLDEGDASCHDAAAWCFIRSGRLEEAQSHLRRAIAINAHDGMVQSHMGFLLSYMGRSKEAAPYFERGERLNPFAARWYASLIGVSAYMESKYEAAASSFQDALDAEWVWDLMYLAAALGQLGRKAEAGAILVKCARLKPDIPVIEFAKAEPYQNPADTEHLIEGLRKAGLDC